MRAGGGEETFNETLILFLGLNEEEGGDERSDMTALKERRGRYRVSPAKIW